MSLTTIQHAFRMIAMVQAAGVFIGFVVVLYSLCQGERSKELAAEFRRALKRN